MYEPDSPEDKLSREIIKKVKAILMDMEHPNVSSMGASKQGDWRRSSVEIDLDNGHSLSIQIFEKTK